MSDKENDRSASRELRWWQRAVIYQIAPMSFQDSNGNGKGDLEGIMQRLSHQEWLGVDAVWLCPIYRSGMLDFGYDIIDYCDVDPLFGSLADFDRLLKAMHGRGIKVLLDFVPNHTSSEHQWFIESRASRENPRRDWYVWADAGADGGPPNNWLSRFGDSAWAFDEKTGQYYYHAFLPEQPDLNWRNPQVRRAMGDVLRFWLRRGVDGFRVDASAVLIEDDLLRDDPPDPDYDPDTTPPPQRLRRIFTDDRPECMECLEELRAVLDEFPDRALAGEVQGKIGRIGHFYGNDRPRLHLPLNFALLDTPWDALSLQGTIDAYLKAIPDHAWPDWVVGGHDKRRVASRIGPAQARILAMLLLTLRGTPFFFAGDEIGMTDVSIPPECVQDVFEQRVPGYGLNRDPERSPMRWDDSANGGFTSGSPWLPMGHGVGERNVARLQQDPRSVLWLYRSLIRLRKQEKGHPCLGLGTKRRGCRNKSGHDGGESGNELENALAMPDAPWWKSAVIYQIYPRSFQDTNNDGVGDLRGIMQRLPYLVELGVDAIWISPLFPSPMADFGYDVSSYLDIDPLFGTLVDFDALVAAAHACGIRVLLDFVPNHTSDQHPWFMESRSARSNPRREWYLWRDPGPAGGVPNNWLSQFGGTAWELDPATGQYYYHAFLREQPDLNWRNPQVRQAMYDAMRFWLRRGVDGFRVDVLWHLIKDDRFRDNPVNPNFAPGMRPHEVLLPLYTTDRPEMEEVVAEMRSVVDEFDDRLLIGEIYLPIERLVKYYGRDLKGAHLPFNFSLLSAPWHAATIAKLIAEYEAALPPGGWPNWVLGNHDRPRFAGRVGRDQARIAAMLLLTLRGTPTIYYGDEIGMTQVAIPPKRVRDPFQKNVPGLAVGRDGCRTPMQWDDSGHAGFSQAEPWLPLGQDFQHMNVAHERADPTSIYNLHRKLIGLRRSRPALTSGSYLGLPSGESSGDLLLFLREAQNERLLVALNFGAAPAVASFVNEGFTGDLLLSSHLDREGGNVRDMIRLRPNEGVVIRISVGNHSDLLRFEHQTRAERSTQ